MSAGREKGILAMVFEWSDWLAFTTSYIVQCFRKRFILTLIYIISICLLILKEVPTVKEIALLREKVCNTQLSLLGWTAGEAELELRVYGGIQSIP